MITPFRTLFDTSWWGDGYFRFHVWTAFKNASLPWHTSVQWIRLICREWESSYELTHTTQSPSRIARESPLSHWRMTNQQPCVWGRDTISDRQEFISCFGAVINRVAPVLKVALMADRDEKKSRKSIWYHPSVFIRFNFDNSLRFISTHKWLRWNGGSQ